MPDTFKVPERPRRWTGKCPAGHTVDRFATETEIHSGELTGFCDSCAAYVLPQWDMPSVPAVQIVTSRYYTEYVIDERLDASVDTPRQLTSLVRQQEEK